MVYKPASHYKDETVAQNYDSERFTSLAGRSFDKLEKYNIRKAFAAVARGAEILDAPCGTGRLAEVLLEDGYQVVGMDISAQMLKVAERKLARFGNRFSTATGDLSAARDADIGRYDAALCARVLVHLPLDEQIVFLKNVARLTAGPVVFTQSLSSRYQKLRRRVKKTLGHQPSVNYPVSEPELQRLLRAAGLHEQRRIRPFALISEEIIIVARAEDAPRPSA